MLRTNMLNRLRNMWLWAGGLLLSLVMACNKEDNVPPATEDTTLAHTVLVYIVAENSLMTYAAEDIEEMLSGCDQMSENDHLIIYFDGYSLPCIYKIDKHTQARKFSDLKPYYTYAEDKNSASAAQLSDFVAKVEKQFPADDYSLILWSHGSGWIPSTISSTGTVMWDSGPKRSFGVDNGMNNDTDYGDEMEIADLADALRSFPKFKFILFDACFMQTIEVDYALKDVADYIVASPAEIPGEGAPYDKYMSLFFRDDLQPSALVNAYVTNYANRDAGALISSVQCSLIDSLTTATWPYLHPLSEKEPSDPYGLSNLDFSNVQNYFDYNQWVLRHTMPDCYDMYSVMKNALPASEFQSWSAIFDRAVYRRTNDCWYSIYPLSNSLKDHILAVNREEYGGISMFVPLDKYIANGHYFFADWYNTAWGQRISAQTRP